MPFAVLLSLFCSIWLIYTLDHLLDAKKLNDIPSMRRHQFHAKYSVGISIGMFLVLLIALLSLLYIPAITMLYGAIVSAVVLVYFILSWNMKIFLIKEVLIASVYATGVLLGPVSLIDIPVNQLMTLLLQIFLLALINLLLLSYYEKDKDANDGQHSWAVRFGVSETKKHIKWCLVFLTALQACSFVLMQDKIIFQVILLGMNGVLYLIFASESYFKIEERYRSYSDMIFFMPGFIFWL